MVAAPSVDPHFRLLRSLAASTASRVSKIRCCCSCLRGFFCFCHPAITFAVVSSCLAAVGSARTAAIDCAYIRTHANLWIVPCPHQTTRREREREQNDAKGDNIYGTTLGGHFFLVVLLRSVVGYPLIIVLRRVCVDEGKIASWIYGILSPPRLFGCLPPSLAVGSGWYSSSRQNNKQDARFYPCTNKSLKLTRTHHHHIR